MQNLRRISSSSGRSSSSLLLDESAGEKAGTESAGTSQQYNRRLGKVDLCQVVVVLGYVNWQHGSWTT